MSTKQITGEIFQQMIAAGTGELTEHIEEINDLNVFPIPDGDTGINMAATMKGGAEKANKENLTLSEAASRIADGMLMGARGNSGVILSQFFAGISDGLGDLKEATVKDLGAAFSSGVRRAYSAVLTPVEGTILTVMREANDRAIEANCEDVETFFLTFITEARRSLQRTPELLIDLRKAGVVDSGGAGLICIAEGMYKALSDSKAYAIKSFEEKKNLIDLDKFTEDSTLEFGYCTEVLVRLQKSKVGDTKAFDEKPIKDYLLTIGNSIVCFKQGSIIKIHVHTFEPYKVLEFCQKYGEFLTIKIENMNLQHNEVMERDSFALRKDKAEDKERKKFATVAVASGEGIIKQFKDFGCDYIIQGGQTMNPSSADFIEAFNIVNADDIFVLPNNGNIILAAKQASGMYKKSKIHVIPTKSIGAGYSVLSMLDYSSNNPIEIEKAMTESTKGVLTGCISQAIHDTTEVKKGDWLGIFSSEIVSDDTDRVEATLKMVDKMLESEHYVLIIIRGKDVAEEEAERIKALIAKKYPELEIYINDGKQDIYSYIVIAE